MVERLFGPYFVQALHGAFLRDEVQAIGLVIDESIRCATGWQMPNEGTSRCVQYNQSTKVVDAIHAIAARGRKF